MEIGYCPGWIFPYEKAARQGRHLNEQRRTNNEERKALC